MLELLIIEGLEQAIVGIALKGRDQEAIVYDLSKVLSILYESGFTDDEVYEYLDGVNEDELGPAAPIFLMIDETLKDDVSSQTRYSQLVH